MGVRSPSERFLQSIKNALGSHIMLDYIHGGRLELDIVVSHNGMGWSNCSKLKYVTDQDVPEKQHLSGFFLF